MFFGKKDEAEIPQKKIRVTVLTDEYIIDAWDDPDLSILQAAYDAEIQEPSGGTIILKDAHVKPLGQVNTPARTFAEWHMPSLVKVIAIFSDDPATENLMNEGWLDYEYYYKALIYAGGYTIEGKIYSEEDAPPTFEFRAFTPLEDAVITYQLDKKTEIMRGRWGVVNSFLMHGFSIEA